MVTFRRSFIALLIAVFWSSLIAQASFFASPYDTSENVSWLVFEGAPGVQVEIPFYINNAQDVVGQFDVGVVDALVNQKGDYGGLRAENSGQVQFGAWSTVSESKLSVEPNMRVPLTLKVDIPSDLPLGVYWGGVTVQESSKDVVQSTGGASLNTVARNAMRVKMTVVAPENYAAIAVEPASLPSSRSLYYGGAVVFLLVLAAAVTWFRRRA